MGSGGQAVAWLTGRAELPVPPPRAPPPSRGSRSPLYECPDPTPGRQTRTGARNRLQSAQSQSRPPPASSGLNTQHNIPTIIDMDKVIVKQ